MDQSSFWTTIGEHHIFCYLYEGDGNSTPILLPNSFGAEYVHCHASLRELSKQLASHGFDVWRFDWPGYGNSSGQLPIPNFVASLMECINGLIQKMAEIYSSKPSLILFRSSALLLPSIDPLTISRVVLWHPIAKGNTFIRGLEAIDTLLKSESKNKSILTAGGYPLFNEDADSLRGMKLNDLDNLEGIPTFVIYDTNKKPPVFLNDIDCNRVTSTTSSDLKDMSRAAEQSTIPITDITKILSWFNEGGNKELVHSKTTLAGDLVNLNYIETSQHLGKERLFCVITTPAAGITHKCLIIPNTGSGHHAGPNRLHVSLARELAAIGYTTVRLDISNLGNSGFKNTKDAFTDRAHKDIDTVVGYLKTKNVTDFNFFGICSGAFSIFDYAIKAGTLSPSRFIFVNVITFHWALGEDPIWPESAVKSGDSTYYKAQATNYKSWITMLSKPSKWLRLSRKAFVLFSTLSVTLVRKVIKKKTRLDKELAQLVKSGHKVLMYTSPGEAAIDLIKSQASYSLKNLKPKVLLTIPDVGDHTFTTIESRENLILDVTNYLKNNEPQRQDR